MFTPERFSAGPKNADDVLVEFFAVDMKQRGFTMKDFDPKSFKRSKHPQTGGTVLLYELKAASAGAYADLTEKNINRMFTIILDGYVISAPIVRSRIPGAGMIEGFSEKQIDEIMAGVRR